MTLSKMMNSRLGLVALVLFFVLGAARYPVEATVSSLPVITRARAELAEGRLFLEGKNFGTTPRVLLGAPAGGFDELVVLSSNGQLIEAELPEVEPGTYLVVVTRGLLLASLDVTFGAVGERGPPGMQGPTGADGTNGLSCWDLDQSGSCDPLVPGDPRNEDANGDGACTPADCIGPRGEQGPPGPSGPAGNLALAGQTCPLGQSIIGFDSHGNIICSGQLSGETCDGIDNNLNGSVDENLVYCFNGTPAPNTDGSQCNPGFIDFNGNRADGCEGMPSPEVCDGVDNDLNGSVDEDLHYCTNGLPAPNTDGARCIAGYFDVNGDPADGCESTVPAIASCGDGILDSHETCDDGNLLNGDGCNVTCRFENSVSTLFTRPGPAHNTDLLVAGRFLYFTDLSSHSIVREDIARLLAGQQLFVTIAGGGVGSVDGPGANARFNTPWGLASDGNTLWVADNGNHAIRAIDLTSPTYDVTTVAGGNPGSADGIGLAAQFNSIYDLEYLGGTVFLVDGVDATLRSFDPNSRAVSTLAGLPGQTGVIDGHGSAARFVSPRDLTSDGVGTLFISDVIGATIRVYDVSTTLVSTFAGSGVQGYLDGVGTSSLVHRPRGIAFDGSSVYWAEQIAHTIRQGVVQTGEVSTMLGTAFSAGYVDGVGSSVRLNEPWDIAYDPETKSLFVAEDGFSRVRLVR